MDTLHQRLADGEVLIIDGATGTELQRRGVPMDGIAWSATANFTHPDVVRAVHEDYIRAGADILIANTFATNRALLERAGHGDRVREANLTAVKKAREAREAVAADRPIYIAGSINVWEPPPTVGETRAGLVEQAELLAEAGVDLIALEMMEDIGEATLAIEAAVATGLPTWVGLSVRYSADGEIVLELSREPLETALQALLPLGGVAVTIMHSFPEVTGPALHMVRQHWKGPLGAYAHMGEFTMPHWHWVNMLSPEEYAAEARQWHDQGVQAIGGCCGLGPDYIRVLKDTLPTRLAQSPG